MKDKVRLNWLEKLFVFLLITGTLSLAAPEDPMIEIIGQQEQKRTFETLQSRMAVPPSAYTEISPQPLSREGNATMPCLPLHRIRIQGVTLLRAEDIRSIISPYVQRCDTLNDMMNMVTKINNLYLEEGYITSRAYIKPQDLSEGELIITVLEGKIESVTGQGVNAAPVFPFIKGSFLNLRDLEARIEQLNRLRSMKVTMGLLPGKEPGYTRVIVTGKQVASRIHGALFMNNYGTASTGKFQMNGSVGWDNPLHLNDLLTLQINATDKLGPEKCSKGFTVGYGLPFGKSYIEFNYDYSSYALPVQGIIDSYRSTGTTRKGELRIGYKLFHDRRQRGEMEGYFERKSTKNFLAGVLLESSSSLLNVIGIGYTHRYTGDRWDAFASFGYRKGLKMLDAEAGLGQKPDFDKFLLDAGLNGGFDLGDISATYSLLFHGQYAPGELVSPEKLSIGGVYSVRGFQNSGSLSGEKGFYLRDEIAIHDRIGKAGISPYLAIDYGYASDRVTKEKGVIVGSAIGSRVNYKNFQLDLFRSIPLKKKYRDEDNGFFGLNLGASF